MMARAALTLDAVLRQKATRPHREHAGREAFQNPMPTWTMRQILAQAGAGPVEQGGHARAHIEDGHDRQQGNPRGD
jgi:hypothetical protein